MYILKHLDNPPPHSSISYRLRPLLINNLYINITGYLLVNHVHIQCILSCFIFVFRPQLRKTATERKPPADIVRLLTSDFRCAL